MRPELPESSIVIIFLVVLLETVNKNVWSNINTIIIVIIIIIITLGIIINEPRVITSSS